MPSCCVPDCKRTNTTHKELSFFTFPTTDSVRKKWLANIR